MNWYFMIDEKPQSNFLFFLFTGPRLRDCPCWAQLEKKRKRKLISSSAFTLLFLYARARTSKFLDFLFIWVLSGPCIRNKKSVTLTFSSSSSFLWAETSGALRAVRPRKEKKKGKGEELIAIHWTPQHKESQIAVETSSEWIFFLYLFFSVGP